MKKTQCIKMCCFALATICVVTGIIAIARKSTIVWPFSLLNLRLNKIGEKGAEKYVLTSLEKRRNREMEESSSSLS